MSFIIKLFDKYYAEVLPDGGFNEVYDPNHATGFPSAAKAKNWMKDNTNMAGYAKAKDALTEIENFEKWAKDGMVRRTFPPLNKKLSRKYNGETPEEVLGWHLSVSRLNRGSDDIKYEDWKTWPKLFMVFECLHELCSFWSEDSKEKCHSFSMAVKPTTEFEVFEKELRLVLPHITMKGKDGGLTIDIFDRFLSEYGNSMSFIAYPDKNIWKFCARYAKDIVFKDLRKAFDWWKQERYYE